MPSHAPSHTSRHGKAPPSVATVKSSHMSDKIRNAPTLGPGDSVSQMSQRSSHAESSHTSRAPKARSSGTSEHRSSRGAGTNDHTRRGESSQLSVISERSGASGNMSGGSKVPSYLSWAPMSNASGGSTPHGSVSRDSGKHAPSRHAAAPSHTSGAAGPSGSHRTAGPSGSHRTAGPSGSHRTAGPSGSHHTAAPMSTHSNMSGQSRSSSGSRQPERQMTVASSAGGQSSRHHSEAPMSQGSVMSSLKSYVSSSSRQSASSSGPHNTSMTQYGGKSGHRSVVPSPLGQAPVQKGMRGSFSTSAPKPGETVEFNINIRTTRK